MKKRRKIKKAGGLFDPSSLPTGHVELQLVRLISSAAQLRLAGGKGLPEKLNLSFSARASSVNSETQGLVDVSVKATLGEHADNQAVVEATFQVIAIAHDGKAILDDTRRKDLVGGACSVAWPYLRHHLQTAFSAMLMPPITLPYFHPVQLNGVEVIEETAVKGQ